MTLAELREYLDDLPASAETAPVFVGESHASIRDVRYERGMVLVIVPAASRYEDCEADSE